MQNQNMLLNGTSGISSKNVKVITLDGAYILAQKTRPNTTNYRTQGDLVSSLSSGNTITLKNPNIYTCHYLILKIK